VILLIRSSGPIVYFANRALADPPRTD